MPATKQMQLVLDEFDSFGAPPITSLTPENARQLPTMADAAMSAISRHAMSRTLKAVPEPIGGIDHKVIPGPAGDLILRLYYPEADGPFPVLVYFHGGGWVIANLDTYDSSCRSLAKKANCIVASVAYRQAPEHPYPAAAEDAFAAYQWVAAHAAAINGDPANVAVGGESAGGNLAAVVCIMAAEQGGPMPLHQLLVYPVIDAEMDTPSYTENAQAKPLNKAMMQWFWQNYAPNAQQRLEPHASPLRATDLSMVPPATIINAEIDPLRSEGELYAQKLMDAGVPVARECYAGVTHEFFGMAAGVHEAAQAVDFAAEQLKNVFDREGSLAAAGARKM